MITLDATTKTLEIDLTSAVATNQLPFVASYVDISQSTFAMTAMGEQDGTSNNTTAVTCLSAPGASTSRVLKFFSWKNSDTAAVEGWIQLNNNGTLREIWKGTLAVGDTLFLVDAANYHVLDANGAVKTSLGSTGQFTTLTVSGNTTLGDAAADSLTVNAGVISMPNWPAFLAYNSATDSNVTGAGTNADYICDTEIYDQGSNYNNATGVFTAPTTGKYRFIARALIQDISAAMTQQNIEIVTSNRTYAAQDTGIAGSFTAREMSIVIDADMDAADTAFPRIRFTNGAGDTADVFGGSGMYTMFCGSQIA